MVGFRCERWFQMRARSRCHGTHRCCDRCFARVLSGPIRRRACQARCRDDQGTTNELSILHGVLQKDRLLPKISWRALKTAYSAAYKACKARVNKKSGCHVRLHLPKPRSPQSRAWRYAHLKVFYIDNTCKVRMDRGRVDAKCDVDWNLETRAILEITRPFNGTTLKELYKAHIGFAGQFAERLMRAYT